MYHLLFPLAVHNLLGENRRMSKLGKLGHEQNIEFSVFAGQLFSALDHEVLEEGFINSKADAENEREGAVSSMRRGVICMQ